MRNRLTLLLFFLLSFPLTAAAICDGHSRDFPLNDPTDNTPWSISSQVFRPLALDGKPFPVVFILPPIEGGNELDKSLALRLCLNGIGAYILNVVKDPALEAEVYDLSSHNEALIRARAGVSAAIDELSGDPDVSGSFGILGASLGGIQSAYIAGSEARIQASVILAGAGNLPGVLAYSDQARVTRVRDVRTELLNITNPIIYESLLELAIEEDPLNHAQNIQPNSMFIFIVLQDTAVPTRYQQQLAQAVRDPKVIEVNATHVPGIAYAGTVFAEEIVEFLEARLE